jgi:hypothetical protein
VLVVALGRRFARDDLLRSQRESEVPDPEQRRRRAELERRASHREPEAGRCLESAPRDEQPTATSVVGEATERDRDKERHERERRRHEPDVPRTRAEPEQAVRRHGAGDVDGGLRRRHCRQRVCQPPGQAGSLARIDSASLGM